MKKAVYFLALLFLLEWAYTTKIKPFVMKEFGNGDAKTTTAGVDTHSPANSPGQLPPGAPIKNLSGSFVYGIDISKWEGNEIDLLDKKKDSLSFIICKATGFDKYGKLYIDPKFKKNWSMTQTRGFVRGAYHFYDCNTDPAEQAKFFFNAVGTINKTDLPPIVDIERPYVNSRCNNIETNILAFLKEIESLYGRRPVIYSNLTDADHFLNDPQFSAYHIWIAYYAKKAVKPKLPVAWEKKGWAFWQRTDRFLIDGIKNDFDVFNGSVDDLKKFISNN